MLRRELGDPPILGLPAELVREHAQVRDDARGDQDVARQVDVVPSEALALQIPRRLLAAETVDQLLGARQLRSAVLLLLLQLLGLLVCLRQLPLELAHDVHHLLQLRLLGGHRGFGLGDLCLGLRQLLLLRADLLGDLVVHDHGAHPLADAHGGERALLDLLRVELLRLVERHDLGNHGFGDVVLVEVDHPVEQPGVDQELLLAGLPVVVDLALAVRRGDLDRLRLEHDAHGLGGEDHARGRGLHGAHLSDVALRQLAQGVEGGLVGRKRQREVLLAVGLDLAGRGLLDVRLGLLLLDDQLLLRGAHLLGLDLLAEDGGLLRGLLQHRLQLVELDLQRGDLLLRVVDLLEAGVVAPLPLLRDLALRLQSGDEGADELQVRRRRDVVVALGLGDEALGEVRGRHLALDHDLHDLGAELVRELKVLVPRQELVGDGLQRVGRPAVEPVDRTAVHQAWERAQPVAERRADGRHADHDVQVTAALLHVPREDLRRAVLAGIAGALAALLADFQLVLVGVQVGDLAGVQDGADLLQEGLPGDLGVREQEDHVLVGAARLHQHPLHVVVPLVQAVALGDRDLEELELRHVGGQGRGRLAAAAADAHEQGVAERQLQHADHAADVLDERHEEH
mmetsp:Transcript_33265/g.88056  ORF Transcript_33265/g.88056 Transcript_33265/m.88056 type:complete len:626 (-) Transcript_33265:810-2687(-)